MASEAMVRNYFRESGLDRILSELGQFKIMDRMQRAGGIIPQPHEREKIGRMYVNRMVRIFMRKFTHNEVATFRSQSQTTAGHQLFRLDEDDVERLDRFLDLCMEALGLVEDISDVLVAAE